MQTILRSCEPDVPSWVLVLGVDHSENEMKIQPCRSRVGLNIVTALGIMHKGNNGDIVKAGSIFVTLIGSAVFTDILFQEM